MSEFYVGQEVVCVNGTWLDPGWAKIQNKPVRGGHYIIRDLLFFDFSEQKAVPSCRLVEITNPIMSWKGEETPCEIAFGRERFRPLQTNSIKLFRQIARDVTEGKKVRIGA